VQLIYAFTFGPITPAELSREFIQYTTNYECIQIPINTVISIIYIIYKYAILVINCTTVYAKSFISLTTNFYFLNKSFSNMAFTFSLFQKDV